MFGVHNIIYMEIYNTIRNLGQIISLREIGKRCIGIKEDYINRELQKACDNDKDNGLKSLRISCKKDSGLFYVELKRFLIKGKVEIPFQVDSFIFNSDVKEITFRIGKEKPFAKGYYCRVLLWFTLSVIGLFNNKSDLLQFAFKDKDYLMKNSNGTYTIDLLSIPGLNDYFKKSYWKLIRIDGILLDNEMVFLQLHKELAEKIVSIPKDIECKINEFKVKSSSILEKLGDAMKGKI